MIKNPETRNRLDALRAELSHSMAAYQTIRDEQTILENNARTIRQAAAVAEADAQSKRVELREMLRASIGKLSKQHHQKSAEHRSAIELSEEYSAIAADIDAQIEPKIFELSDAASIVLDLRKRLLKTFADAVVSEAIAEIAPRLQLGLAIQQRLEGAEFFNDRLRVYWGNEDELVLADLRRVITAAIESPELEPAELPEELRTAVAQANLGDFKPMSPIQCALARKKLASSTVDQEAA